MNVNKNNNNQNDNTDKEIPKNSNLNIETRIQIVLAILTFGTLAFYVIFSSIQISQTKAALDKVDITNAYTKESIKLAKESGLVSDSLNRKAIEIADSSLKISSKIAKMQEEFTEKELRAYMTISDKKLIEFTPNERISFGVKFINTGKTPASEIISNCGVYISEKEFPENAYLTLSNYNNIIGGTEIKGSNIDGVWNYRSDLLLTNSEYEAIIKGDKILYLFGYLFYKDIFGYKHKVRFCFYYSPPISPIIYTYKKYNDYD